MDEGDAVNSEHSEFAETERELRQQVEQSEAALDGLRRDLEGVNAELEALVRKNQQFVVLEQVCRSLEELEVLGATHLFFDGQGVDGDAARHLTTARRRIDEHGDAIARIEDRRQAIVARIGSQDLVLDGLYVDLNEAIEREETRRSEWLVEREADVVPFHQQVMPWARGCEEDDRFRKSLGISVLASLVLAVLVSSIALPIIERSRLMEVPERVAKLVRQDLPPPPPPAPVEEPVVDEDIPEPDPEPELAEEQPPKETPQVTEEPAVAAVEKTDTREEVKSKGILAFRETFANSATLRPAAQLGSQARVRTEGQDAVGRPERSMVTTLAPGSSGGINLADISRDVGGGGGGGMGGVEVTRVASSIGGGGTADRPLSGGSASAGRTDEEIQIVFDRYKAALYRLYNRELRKDPTLRGQIILRLTIEPDGTVSFCTLQASDMNAPVLAQQVVERVSTFDFGAKDGVVAMTIIYPIDFLPAA